MTAVGGKGRAKNKDSDGEKSTGGEKDTGSNTKTPKTGEVNPGLLNALNALDMPVGNKQRRMGTRLTRTRRTP